MKTTHLRPQSRPVFWLLPAILSILVMAACQAATTEATPTAAPPTAAAVAELPTETAAPTATEVPTETPEPTATAAPTETAVPTDTPEPTSTPVTEAAEATVPPTPEEKRPTPTAEAKEKEKPEEPPAASGETGEETAAATATPVPTPEGAPDAFELIALSGEAHGKLTSMSQTQIISLTSDVITQTQTQTCHYEIPDSAYCQNQTYAEIGGQVMTTTIELVYSNETFWLREGEGEWEEMPEDFVEQMGFAEDFADQTGFNFNEELILDASITGEETIDDAPVYHVKAKLDLMAMFDLMLNEEMAGQFIDYVEDSDLVTAIWIGQEDYLVRRQSVTMSFTIEGIELRVITESINSGFNEPVDIPDPAAES